MVMDPWQTLSAQGFQEVVQCFPEAVTKWSVTLKLLNQKKQDEYENFLVLESSDALVHHPLFHKGAQNVKHITDITVSNLSNSEIVELYASHCAAQAPTNCRVFSSAEDQKKDEEESLERRRKHPMFSFQSCSAYLIKKDGFYYHDFFQFRCLQYFIITGEEFSKTNNEDTFVLTLAQRIHLLKTLKGIPVFYPTLQNNIDPGWEYRRDFLSPTLLNQFAYALLTREQAKAI